MHAWLAALCGMAGGGALAALPLFFARSDRFEPMPDDSERQKNRAGRDAASTVTLDEVMACLPAATLVLNDTRLPCVISSEAKRQFTNSIGSIIRHPAFQSAVDRLLAQKKDDPLPAEALIVLDIPHYRIVRAWLQKRIVPDVFLSEGYRKGGGAFSSKTTLVFVALHDETEAVLAERQHTDFVAFASHELRTPLASLLGFIETLQGPAADDPVIQKEFLGIMSEQAKRMQRLLDGLLYLSRVQMQEHHRPKETIGIAELLKRLSDEASGLIAGKPVRFQVQADGVQELCVQGDEAQLLQVLMNLVENALKYGLFDRGKRNDEPLGITVACARAAKNVGWPTEPGLVLSVTDTGPGIPARHLNRLTERFYRVAKTAASVQGSGLGLAIVQQILARHDGRFVVESTVGEGTSCRIWLPLLS
ncbi:two-component sensor histidine kinase [Acetobacter lambici]|uniref:histidine kinase n=1 Tax=Acetobacter lambici TaxID=1332824 RepID=A0ABT1EXR6_9PROT|nr:ATP-binding protein [Acetobacter lambici]MCP1241530.1 ATP-binding protein [Acetobacter lambici]MCP1257750.1 ATP-binding protein [Acetobacter lambici]NHO56153.1 two-component sensor histidine kinase [Acetobacter lambici]